jgi:Ferritin-like domain
MKDNNSRQFKNRRSFLRGSLATGAAVIGTGALSGGKLSAAPAPTRGDVAILKFLAAAELIEADLWQQYAELGGLTPGQFPVETFPANAPFMPMNSYQSALMNLDPDGPQYISSNNTDEQSHAAFLNAYLVSIGAQAVNLDEFRTLPSSQATPARQIGRLTNLMNLTVDTSWFTRYHSTTNPDLGATFAQALNLVNVPGIPRTNADYNLSNIQAIANIAAFHFGFIEQGGSSLYATLSQKVSSPEVLKITLSIGGDEICHFLEWVDFSGNSVQPPLAPLPAASGLPEFPNFDASSTMPGSVSSLLQTNLIFPVPCEFINSNLPLCAVIRPTSAGQIDAVGLVNAFIADGLFIGQSQSFIEQLAELATAADAAQRTFF